MYRILCIRLSALGDVAMTVPVIDSAARQHPELRFSVATQRRAAALFDFMPPNVEVIPFDKSRYAGVRGLEHFCKLLRRRKFDAVADLHDVLRSKYLRTRLRMGGARVAVIDKDRAAKRLLLGHGVEARPLLGGVERYAHVLTDLGVSVRVNFRRLFDPRMENFQQVESRVGRKPEGTHWVGIAPFAAHGTKIYPAGQMRRVAQLLRERGCRVLLFGGGEAERAKLAAWEGEGIESVCGRMGGLHNEMLLMSQLDCMIVMDSANMHIAALTGIPVLSIWGATHPKMGFAPYGQPASRQLQCDDLPCRPCSVYGNQPCRYGDLHCMTGIRPETVAERCWRIMQEADGAARD